MIIFELSLAANEGLGIIIQNGSLSLIVWSFVQVLGNSGRVSRKILGGKKKQSTGTTSKWLVKQFLEISGTILS